MRVHEDAALLALLIMVKQLGLTDRVDEIFDSMPPTGSPGMVPGDAARGADSDTHPGPSQVGEPVGNSACGDARVPGGKGQPCNG